MGINPCGPFTMFLFELKAQKQGPSMSLDRLICDGHLQWQRLPHRVQSGYEARLKEAEQSIEFQEFAEELQKYRAFSLLDQKRKDSKGILVSDKIWFTAFGDKRVTDRIELNEALENRCKRDKSGRLFVPAAVKLRPQPLFHLYLDIRNVNFGILATEYMVKTEAEEFFPREISLTLWNMEKGPFKTFHTIVEPKDVPPGYKALAKEHSELRHEIPIVSNFSSDFAGICKEMKEMLSLVRDPDHTADPMVFTLADEYRQTLYAVDYLRERAPDSEFWVNMACIEDLAGELQKFCGLKEMGPDEMEERFRKSTHDFAKGIRCDYHETKDVKYCCRAQTLRECYHLLDMMPTQLSFGIPERYSENPEYYKQCLMERIPVFKPPLRRSSAESSAHEVVSLGPGGSGMRESVLLPPAFFSDNGRNGLSEDASDLRGVTLGERCGHAGPPSPKDMPKPNFSSGGFTRGRGRGLFLNNETHDSQEMGHGIWTKVKSCFPRRC